MMLVRTTLTVRDDLLHIARKRAVETRRTLKDVINEALSRGLHTGRSAHPSRNRYRLRTHPECRPQPGVNLESNSALLDLMDGL